MDIFSTLDIQKNLPFLLNAQITWIWIWRNVIVQDFALYTHGLMKHVNEGLDCLSTRLVHVLFQNDLDLSTLTKSLRQINMHVFVLAMAMF